MRYLKLYIFLVALFVVSCESIDGNKDNLSINNYFRCSRDMECGIGRYCSEDGICSIDCTSDKDCGFLYQETNSYYCSPCGRCLKKGVKDTKCIVAKDIPCFSDSECVDKLTEGYICGASGFCVKKCSSDTDCRRLGRGWSCGDDKICIRRCYCNKDCYFFGWGYECVLPSTVDDKENCNSDNPVYGECLPREGGIDWGEHLNYEKDSYKYTGIWAWNVNYAVRTTGLPLVSQQDSVSIAYGLAKITQNSGGGIDIHLKLCSIRLKNFKEDDSNFEDIAYIVVPDSYADSIPVLVNRTAAVPPMKSGVEFSTDIIVDVRGARLPDPVNSPLPDYENMEYVYDQDRDGKPGMTVFVSGVLTGEVYNVQRWSVRYNINVIDENRMSGLIDFLSEESIVGASNKLFLTKIKVVPHYQYDRSYFRAMRINSDADCNTVIDMSKDEKSYIYFTPHYSE